MMWIGMPASISLTTDQVKLRRIQAQLKEAGSRGLVRELNKALKSAAEPIAVDERVAALALPSKGKDSNGLRQGIADGVHVIVSRSKTSPGVRILSRAKLARASNRRSWRHPVFGNRNVWVVETLSPGWWPATARRHKAAVTRQIHEALNLVAKQIKG
jgi:hypothetical protein